MNNLEISEKLVPENIKEFLKEIEKDIKSKEATNEVELKIFYKDRILTKEEIKGKHKNIQDIILNKLNGEVIFDGKIKDTRYLDVPEKNKDESYLKENGITIIRIRTQTNNNNNSKENLYTVKMIGEKGYSNEYEKKVDENYGKTLEKKGLQKIKTSEKTRKEMKFEVFIEEDGKKIKKEVKVAFDGYTDERLGILKPFFEIESDDEDVIKETIKILELDEKDFFLTTGGPEKLLKNEESYKNLDKIDPKENKLKYNTKIILKLIEEILNYDSIFSEIGDFINNENISELNLDNYKKFEIFIKKILKISIKKIIDENNDYFYFFSRLFDEETIKTFNPNGKININFGKKFNDKFEREFPGYTKALMYSILNNFNSKENITGNIDFAKSIKDKINNFLQVLFLFDDNLTKEEIIKFLDKSDEYIKMQYNSFEKNILNTFNQVKNTKVLNSEYNIYFLQIFVTIYKNGIRSIGLEKNKKLNKEEVDIIKENIENITLNLLSQLSSNFSKWLDANQTPKEKLENYLGIKKLFKEMFLHIYLFKKNNICFSEIITEKFNPDLVIDILKKYSDKIFNSSNFLKKEIEEEILRDFLGNLFEEENKYKNNIKKYGEKIESYFEKDLKKILNNLNSNKKIDNKNEDEEINFDLWNKLTADLRLKTFLNKVFIKGENNKDAYFNQELFKNISDDKDENLNEFSKEEFEKKYGDSENKDEYTKYEEDIYIQFQNTTNNFKKLKNIDELYKYVEDNINDFHLIIAWFHFGLRKKHSKENNKKMNTLEIESLTFTEQVIGNLKDKNLIKIGTNGEIEGKLKGKLRIGTSNSYNTITWDLENLTKLFKRIANGKSADLNNNFSIQIHGQKEKLKNIQGLYTPEQINRNTNNLEKIKEYVNDGLSIVRKFMDGKKINKNSLPNGEEKYLTFLEKINFPINEEKYQKKLLEFLKFIKKETFGIITKQHINSEKDTKFIEEKFKNNNGFIEKIFTGTHGDLDDIIIGGTKTIIGGYIKGISKYGGNYEKIGDKTRMTILGDSVYNLALLISNFIEQVNKIPEVVKIKLEDKIGNIFKKAKRENGYRDVKITLDLKNGNSVEVQFQLKDYFKIKHTGMKIDSDLEKKLNPQNDSSRKIVFDKTEITKIINFYKNINEKIPKDFTKIFLGLTDSDLKKDEYKNIFSDKVLFSADFTYRLEREIGIESIINKFKEIDIRLFDGIAAGKIAKKEIQRIME